MNNLLGVIGLAYRAGKIKFGVEQTVTTIRAGKKEIFVCLSSDSSANSKKKVTDCCKFYGIDYFILPVSGDDLGKCIGKTMGVSAIAVTDNNFRTALLKQIRSLTISESKAPQEV